MYRVSFVRGRPAGLHGRWAVVSSAIAALSVAFALVAVPAPASANPKYAAIVVDAVTGKTLFARNADARRFPASLTKVMTVYIIFEEIKAGRLTLDSRLNVSAHAAARPPSKIGVREGSTIRVEDAIKALVTKSANDVAVVVAENISGSESAFARRMTETARRLGMRSTTFRNASGLPNDKQVTTARDMARLGLAVQRDHPRFYGYFSLRSFKYRGETYRNHNRLLGRVDGVDGIKTGFIRASGFNLLSSVRRNDRHIVAVVMGGRTGRTRNAHMTELITAWLPKASRGAGSAPIFTAHRRVTTPRPKPYSRVLAAVIERSMVSDEALAMRDPDAMIEEFAVATIRRDAVPIEPTARPPQRLAQGSLGPADDPLPRRVRTVRVTATPDGLGRPQSDAAAAIIAESASQARTRRLAMAEEYGSADAPDDLGPPDTSLGAGPPGWQIQIAAASSREGARGAIETVKARFPDLLGDRMPVTMRVATPADTLWRARFAGFTSQEEANAACQALKRAGQSCWAEAM